MKPKCLDEGLSTINVSSSQLLMSLQEITPNDVLGPLFQHVLLHFGLETPHSHYLHVRWRQFGENFYSKLKNTKI